MEQADQDTGTPGSGAPAGLLLTESPPAPTELDAASTMCHFGNILALRIPGTWMSLAATYYARPSSYKETECDL